MDIIDKTLISVFGPDFIKIQAGAYKDEDEEKNKLSENSANLNNSLKIYLVKKYFKTNSLVEMVKQLRNLRKNQNKILAKEARILLIETGLEDLKREMENVASMK